MPKPVVIIESPYAGNTARNVAYARECLLDSLMRGEAPFASHLLYPQILDDDQPDQREMGIDCQLAWLQRADQVAVYVDFGTTDGMRKAINLARDRSIPLTRRELPPPILARLIERYK